MGITTHELANILLSQEDTIFKFGQFNYDCGCEWWEEIDNFKYTFSEEGFILEEINNG